MNIMPSPSLPLGCTLPTSMSRTIYSPRIISQARSFCFQVIKKNYCYTCNDGNEWKMKSVIAERRRLVVVRRRVSSERELHPEEEEEEEEEEEAMIVAAATRSESDDDEKEGSVVGAVALIVGTSIGSGILAVPQRTAPAGFIPSATCIIICWIFLVIEALLLVEINVQLRRKQKKDERKKSGNLQVLSVRSMAQETLGEWGGNLATTTYLFLSYTCMVAYTSKSGEVLSHLIDNIPASLSGNLFTAVVALLVAIGGTSITDQVNQVLTFFMIGLLLTIEASAIAFGGGLSVPANSNWEQVPATLPVIIFTLVYHDIAPVICAYLGGDLVRIRLSILVGSLVPLVSLLVWDDIALGLSPDLDGFDPLDMLKTEWGHTVVETFSLLAVGTSLIGTLLGASQFFVEQLTNLVSSIGPSIQRHEQMRDDIVEVAATDEAGTFSVKRVLENNKLRYISTSVVVLPTMLISTILPNSFSIATDIAGGYCMILLYGALPPLMAWAMDFKLFDDHNVHERKVQLSSAKPVLVGMGVFSVMLVFEQILQDLVSFDSYLFS